MKLSPSLCQTMTTQLESSRSEHAPLYEKDTKIIENVYCGDYLVGPQSQILLFYVLFELPFNMVIFNFAVIFLKKG